MRLGRVLVGAGLVIVVVVLLWHFLPGGRQRVRDAYRQHGGWTEEARKDDPVGFIEHAEKKLGEHLAGLKETRRRLAEAEGTIGTKLEEQRGLLEASEQLAGSFRDAYRRAEADQSYPVTVAGKEYTRDTLIEQVRLILLQRKNYAEIIEDFEQTAVVVKEKQQQLVTHISDTEAALATLPAKKEIARIGELTGSSEELLAQVNELIGRNESILGESPVRTVEDLIRAQQEPAGAGAEIDVDVQSFLDEGE
jgi:hypothetical protein